MILEILTVLLLFFLILALSGMIYFTYAALKFAIRGMPRKERVKQKEAKRRPVQTTLNSYIKREPEPHEDNEYSELFGYESSAEMDLEDEGD